MKRDTVSAYRARQKSMQNTVDSAVLAVKAEYDAKWKAAKAAAAEAESNRRIYTRDDCIGATHIIDQFGKLRSVVRVNQKTVSVTTEWSWSETVPFDRVRAVKR